LTGDGDVPDLLTFLALAAFVLLLAGLTEGFVSRAPISFPAIFLAVGYLLGPHGLRVITLDPHSPMLEAIATVTLALVLFLDAVRLKLDRATDAWLVPALVLGPGTLLCILVVAATAHLLFDLGVGAALLLGAVLSSTDPVVVRDVVRDQRIPSPVRDTLILEAATNDVVVLPIVLITIAAMKAVASGWAEWLLIGGKILLVGPLLGFVVGAVGAWAMTRADRRFGIRREYQALYGMGLVFAAYSTGVAAGGDGFLAAFAAGAAIAALGLELCDCFVEYGEATSEMIMLFTFILFGAVLSTEVTTIPLGAALALAAVTLLVARPAAVALVLRRAAVSRGARLFIGWFGPRGLASLLLALLIVQAELAEGRAILAIAGVVVTVSVVLHGITGTPMAAWYARKIAAGTVAEERVSSVEGLLRREEADAGAVARVEPRQLVAMLAGPDPPLVLDVRSRSSYEKDPAGIAGGVRVAPDRVDEWAAERTPERPIVTYCT
jgi:NhaP-type Na+/H+ or K+/H+ antiporter